MIKNDLFQETKQSLEEFLDLEDSALLYKKCKEKYSEDISSPANITVDLCNYLYCKFINLGIRCRVNPYIQEISNEINQELNIATIGQTASDHSFSIIIQFFNDSIGERRPYYDDYYYRYLRISINFDLNRVRINKTAYNKSVSDCCFAYKNKLTTQNIIDAHLKYNQIKNFMIGFETEHYI